MAPDESLIEDSLPDAATAHEDHQAADRPGSGVCPARALSGSGRGLLLALVVVLLPTALGGVAAIVAEPWLPASDNGLIAMTVQDLRGGDLPLTGVYSRFGFHHPGPALFFWLAPFQALFGQQGLLVGALALSLASLATMVWLLWRRGGDGLALAGAIALLVLVRSIGVDVAGPWNPWMTTLPMGVVVLAAWSVWCRDSMALPILAIAGSWCVQVHVGSAVPVVVLGLFAVVGIVVAWRSGERPQRWPVVATLAASAMVWFLPVVDVVRNEPDNVRRILDAFSHPSEPSVGAVDGARVAARELGIVWLTGRPVLEPFSGQVKPAALPVVLPLVGLLATVLVVSVRRRDPTAASLAVTSLLAVTASMLAIARITGPALPYLFRWTWTIAALAWLAVGWGLWRWLVPLLSVTGSRWVPKVAGAFVVVAVAVLAPWVASRIRTGERQDETVSRATRELAPHLAPLVAGGGPVLVSPEGEAWGVNTVAIITELRRRGIDARGRNGDFNIARWAIGDDVPTATVTVVLFEPRLERRANGEVPTLAYQPLSPSEEAELNDLSGRAVAFWASGGRGEAADRFGPEQARRLEALRAKGDPVDLYVEVR